MKRNHKNSILAIIVSLFVIGTFTACDEDNNMELPYLFRPINFNVELNKTEATFSWAPVDSAVSYTLQVSTDSINYTSPVLDTTVTTLSFKYEFGGKTNYFARLKANAASDSKNSKFNILAFRTPAENLFEGYKSMMSDWKSITVKWRPGANVTSVKLFAGETEVKTVDIPSGNQLSGELQISSLDNAEYKVEIYNGLIQRGSVNVTVEGDVYVEVGADVASAITNASEGQVIVLAPGALFQTGSSVLRLSKNIKVKGASPVNLPILAMTQGTPTTTSAMLGFTENAIIDYVRFENIDFTGFCDNNINGTKIGYLFNNNLMSTVNTLSFDNCKLRNFGNTPLRVQGAKNQVIENAIFRKCIINDIGFTSTYAVVNSNSADFINNIVFEGCTVYNFKGSLVLRTGQTLKSIKISNCTINQGMQDPASSRYLIDANTATFTEGGITIDRSIFGSSGNALGANGVRTTGTLAVTGSYYTTDYVDDPVNVVTSFSIKKFMTAYPGASTDLWNNPVNGDFTLKAAAFAGKGVAGDLRWY